MTSAAELVLHESPETAGGLRVLAAGELAVAGSVSEELLADSPELAQPLPEAGVELLCSLFDCKPAVLPELSRAEALRFADMVLFPAYRLNSRRPAAYQTARVDEMIRSITTGLPAGADEHETMLHRRDFTQTLRRNKDEERRYPAERLRRLFEEQIGRTIEWSAKAPPKHMADTEIQPEDVWSEASRALLSGEVSSDLVKMYLREVGKVALLSAAEEVDLAKSIEAGLYASHLLAQGGLSRTRRRELQAVAADGERAKDHLVCANLRLVVSIAKRFTERGMPFLDLIQEGNIGLMHTVKKFDYTQGYKFSTYATRWILDAIDQGRAKQARTIRLPIAVAKKITKMEKLFQQMDQELGRELTLGDLAHELDMDEDAVRELIEWSRGPASLDSRVNDDDETLGDFVADFVADDRPEYDTESRAVDAALNDHRRKVIKAALSTLSSFEATVLKLWYGLDCRPMTGGEIGKAMGKNGEYIRQVRMRAEHRLLASPMAETLHKLLGDE